MFCRSPLRSTRLSSLREKSDFFQIIRLRPLQHWHILVTPNDYDNHACFDEKSSEQLEIPKKLSKASPSFVFRSDIIAITAYITIAGDRDLASASAYSGFVSGGRRGGFFPVGFLIQLLLDGEEKHGFA